MQWSRHVAVGRVPAVTGRGHAGSGQAGHTFSGGRWVTPARGPWTRRWCMLARQPAWARRAGRQAARCAECARTSLRRRAGRDGVRRRGDPALAGPAHVTGQAAPGLFRPRRRRPGPAGVW